MSVLASLDARDRALFARMSSAERSALVRRVWTLITHLGGATASILAALLPAMFGTGDVANAGRQALLVLVLSHVAVQIVKRTVGRPRPSRTLDCAALIQEPDRFSFPSGHAAAAMSVAFTFAVAFPSLGGLLIPLALLVGSSRVVLGVHYPGDVLIGELIAVLTALPMIVR